MRRSLLPCTDPAVVVLPYDRALEVSPVDATEEQHAPEHNSAKTHLWRKPAEDDSLWADRGAMRI